MSARFCSGWAGILHQRTVKPPNNTLNQTPKQPRCACGFAPMTRSESCAFLPRQGPPLNSRSVGRRACPMLDCSGEKATHLP